MKREEKKRSSAEQTSSCWSCLGIFGRQPVPSSMHIKHVNYKIISAVSAEKNLIIHCDEGYSYKAYSVKVDNYVKDFTHIEYEKSEKRTTLGEVELADTAREVIAPKPVLMSKAARKEQGKGYKLHIMIDDSDFINGAKKTTNIEKAWNCIKEILVQYKLRRFKIIKDGESRKTMFNKKFERGKAITIYVGRQGRLKEDRTRHEWEKLIRALENSLFENGITVAKLTKLQKTKYTKENEAHKNSKLIPGSRYISYRSDSDDPTIPNPFLGIDIEQELCDSNSNSFSQEENSLESSNSDSESENEHNVIKAKALKSCG